MEELSHELEWKKNEGEPLTEWIAITVVCDAVSLALYVLDRGGFNPENINVTNLKIISIHGNDSDFFTSRI